MAENWKTNSTTLELRLTSTWRASIDLYSLWEFQETLHSWLKYELADEAWLRKALSEIVYSKNTDVVSELNEKYNSAFFWEDSALEDDFDEVDKKKVKETVSKLKRFLENKVLEIYDNIETHEELWMTKKHSDKQKEDSVLSKYNNKETWEKDWLLNLDTFFNWQWLNYDEINEVKNQIWL